MTKTGKDSNDAKVARLNEIRFRFGAASTDWQIGEAGAGTVLFARLTPDDPPSRVLAFDAACAYQDLSFVTYAHADIAFLLDLLAESFDVCRALRRALERQPKPKDYAAECAIKCAKPDFQSFLREIHGLENADDNIRVDSRIRHILSITSRTELNTDPDALARWRKLVDDFDIWRKRT